MDNINTEGMMSRLVGRPRVIAGCSKRGALNVVGETVGILPSVRALQIPSPGWERVRVRRIKKADSDNFVSEQ